MISINNEQNPSKAIILEEIRDEDYKDDNQDQEAVRKRRKKKRPKVSFDEKELSWGVEFLIN